MTTQTACPRQTGSNGPRSNSLGLAALAVIATLGLGALGLTALQPVPTAQQVAVIFPPWTNGVQILRTIARAEGRIVAAGAASTIVIVRGDRPGISDRLRAAGAWAIVDARLARGCLDIGAAGRAVSL